MRDDKGQSPLDVALGIPNSEGVTLYLMSRGCVCGDEDKAELLCGACQWGKLGVVKELAEQHKVDPKSECDNVHQCTSVYYYRLTFYTIVSLCIIRSVIRLVS